ncbi:MAG: response regulator [Alphaproteobacteria bacterium]|nr:response regulator [Alphaproteobacteria bacterium]
MRLLIVEDNTELADIVAQRLADVRLASDRTASAEEAQLLIETGDYGAMVLDLGLPDGDGIDLLRWLRETGRDLPVLVMTARSAVADRVAGLSPHSPDEL